MDNLVGSLAIFTLLVFVLIAGGVYLRSLRDEKNRDAAKAVSRDESSAHTAVRGGRAPEHLR